jgi:hypothetical protein
VPALRQQPRANGVDGGSHQLRYVLLNVVNVFSLFITVIALSASPRSFAAEQPSDVPTWLKAHVGEGETANARQRAIGGHAAVSLRGICLLRDPRSRYANHDGYVPLGTLGLLWRPQRRLHQLVAVGRPTNRCDDKGQSNDAVHLS